MLHISEHCIDQSQIRHLESELEAGMRLIERTSLPGSVQGEVNFIIERKTQVLHRPGSHGDLVIIGVNWTNKVAKSIFLQNEDQIPGRQASGRVYCSLLHR